jgi:transposase
MVAGGAEEVAISAAEWAAVEAQLRRRDLAPRLRERLEMVKAAALGQDLIQIATWSGRSVRTVRRWLRQFHHGGSAALADAPRPGRPAKADAAYLAALARAVETPPPALDLPFDVWTSDRLSAYLAETTGIRLAPGWVRVLLRRQDFVTGRPKHSLQHLQDATEIAAFEQDLAAMGEKAGRRARTVRGASPG